MRVLRGSRRAAVWPADRAGDRLKGEQAQLLHHFIEVGEYGLALEETAGALAQDKIAITDQERGDMLALTRQMKMGDLVPSALGFCSRTT